jgi:urease subunit beta
VTPGEVVVHGAPVEINPGRPHRTVRVLNTGDRPVQVGSHFHFAEANPALEFDRAGAWGHRLGVPAGTSVRFEPGIGRDVVLVPFAGRRVAAGFRGAARGPVVPGGDGGAATGG